MESDLFASLRKRDTGVSTSWPAAAVQHDETSTKTRPDPQISAEKHRNTENTPLQEHPRQHGARAAVGGRGGHRAPSITDRDNQDLPREWRLGLNRLLSMAVPDRVTRDRWQEIVRDAHVFAWGWHDEAIAAGWSIGAAFGIPEEPGGVTGLVLDIRGGRVVGLRKDDRGRDLATILMPGGTCREHYQHLPDSAPPIWALVGQGHR